MRTRMLAAIAVIGMLTLAGCTAPPVPEPAGHSRPTHPPQPAPAPPLPLDQVAAYGGVAALNAGSNCTGTLIDTGVESGPAYVLTNGHCVGDIGRSAQQTTIDEDWFGDAEFFRAEGNLSDTYKAEVVQLAYSTMRLTDTAILRLAPTLGQLEELGIRPVRIAEAEPAAGTKVVNVGVPVHDLFETDQFLRKGVCTLGSQHTVIEFRWLWRDVWSNDCPGILQGSSGSPVLETDADDAPTRIVAMINTTSNGVTKEMGGACFLNRPCQVTASGPKMVENTSYAQSVAGVGRCFSATTGDFALGGGCPLPVSDVWAEEGGGAFRGGTEPDSTGLTPRVRLVGRTAGTVRTALKPLGDGTACSSASTYAGAASHALPAALQDTWDASAGLTLPVDLPATEGFYLQCAVRGDDYAAAASVLFQVDRTPPVGRAGASVEDIGDGVVVMPHLDPPEISTVRFTWGPKGRTDCADTSAFQDFFIQPAMIAHSDLPATYCIYGLDAAGNRTPVATIEIPRP